MRSTGLALIAFLASLVGAGIAQEQRPPWLTDEVIAAAMAIELTAEQRVPFRDSVTLFLESYRDAVQKVIRRGGANLELKIERTRNSLARDMDERMSVLLTEEQMVRYPAYRGALLDALEQR